RLPVVSRVREPDLALLLTESRANLDAVPGDVHTAVLVRGDGAATVERGGCPHQVTLLLESRARIVQPGIQHRRSVHATASRHRLAGTVPRHVDTAALAHGDLTAANGASCNCAACLTVNANRFGEAFLASLASNIEQIARTGIALEVEQM